MLRSIRRAFASLVRNQSGAAAVEYGIICATMAVVMAVSLRDIGPALNDTFTTISHALDRAH